MATLSAFIVLVTLTALIVSRDDAMTQSLRHGGWAEFRQFADHRTYLIQKTHRVRERRCLDPRRVFHRNMWFRGRPGLYQAATKNWRRKVQHDRDRSSRCEVIPAWPWLALASCESGRDWTYNGPSGFDGGFQFLPSTWNSAKGYVGRAQQYGYAYQAPAYVQYLVARSWLARTSWLQWPVCSARIGAR